MADAEGGSECQEEETRVATASPHHSIAHCTLHGSQLQTEHRSVHQSETEHCTSPGCISIHTLRHTAHCIALQNTKQLQIHCAETFLTTNIYITALNALHCKYEDHADLIKNISHPDL